MTGTDFRAMLDENVARTREAITTLRDGGWRETAARAESDLKRFEGVTAATLPMVAIMSNATANHATHMARMMRGR